MEDGEDDLSDYDCAGADSGRGDRQYVRPDPVRAVSYTHLFDGLFVDKANHVIKELLREKQALMGEFDLNHSYPHCWRCHHPLIFRATEQWFIGMETPVLSPKGGGTFRERALEEIGRVIWDPEWGEERISNMIATRPDWCISRQRIWGVPIAVFLCEKCHEPLNDEAINASVVELFARDGADAVSYTHLDGGSSARC